MMLSLRQQQAESRTVLRQQPSSACMRSQVCTRVEPGQKLVTDMAGVSKMYTRSWQQKNNILYENELILPIIVSIYVKKRFPKITELK